jgi:hypothetical protein
VAISLQGFLQALATAPPTMAFSVSAQRDERETIHEA